MKQALDALEKSNPDPRKDDDDYCEAGWKEHANALQALRAAIARDDLKDDLTIAPIAGAASSKSETVRLGAQPGSLPKQEQRKPLSDS